MAASIPAALLFAAALTGLALAAGVRPARPDARAIAAGVAGAALLVIPWVVARGGLAFPVARPDAALAVWTPAVMTVAVAEEALLRGALFTALLQRRGAAAALVVTTAAFALMHLPLYGVAALPVDAAVGLLLGGLRLITGGWAGPAMAHALADLAGGWL